MLIPFPALQMSSYESTSIQSQNQVRCKDTLEGKNLVFETIDGALEHNKDMRNKLFSISNVRGKYPQVFIKGENGDKIEFIGLWDKIEVTSAIKNALPVISNHFPQSLLDCDALPAEVLAANPGTKVLMGIHSFVN
jgi:hypothetical protein